MNAQYNVPLQLNSQNGQDYIINDNYPHDGVTPPGMGWDGQSDGGGKFRLKRRRRCGQCGPCQVKENCNKCQYCMRKDVLKQACVYRKCVYLRKPVSRFRQEPTSVGNVSRKSACTPPHKPTSTPVPSVAVSATNSSTTNSTVSNSNNNSSTPVSNPSISSPTPVGAPSSHATELSSCRLNQSPFATISAMQSMNNGILDPLRHRMIEQPHRPMFESMNHHSSLDPARSVLDPSKPLMADLSRFTGGTVPPSLTSHCKLNQPALVVSHTNTMNTVVASSLNSMNSALGSHHPHHQPSKCPPSLPPRDPCFPSMDTWSSMPYALPHTTAWGTPSLPSHHVAAATYGFPQHSTPFPSSFSPSSCQLSMSDPSAPRFVSPAAPQHSLHHSMAISGFSQDFAHSASNHANHTNIRTPINPPFYAPSPHITPSSIHNFPGLGQFSASQASFGPAAYTMHPHAHMYPSSFYSFRAATEPQIYHIQVYPSQNPFRQSLQHFQFFCQNENRKNIPNLFSEFDFSVKKDIDILNNQYLNKINSSKDEFILSFSVNAVEILISDQKKCDSLKVIITSTSDSQCDFDSVKDIHEVYEEFDQKKNIVYCRQGRQETLLTNSVYDAEDIVRESVESINAKNVFRDDHDDSNCIQSFLMSDSMDLDLQDDSILNYHSVVCDDFICEGKELELTMCSRAMELGADITRDDDDDDDSDDDVQSLQIEKTNPVSSDSSSSSSLCMNTRSLSTTSQYTPSSTSFVPSTCKVLHLHKERKYNFAKGSETFQSNNILSTAGHENIFKTFQSNKILSTAGHENIFKTLQSNKILSTAGHENIFETFQSNKILSTAQHENIQTRVQIKFHQKLKKDIQEQRWFSAHISFLGNRYQKQH